ncbi:ScbR family autoregulator-binding transcription factor [Jannaschia sp. R86511]|uniref:ScbR family autoregulator-binding transcription factor n=1 Tax=Jannaschia sp. R86511 TaxID=3093853 RepID=UPI0036D3AF3E
MPQQQRAIDTRRNALVGSAVVIDRLGYETATIAEMVHESGITKGALYFHFPSKEAVAEAIIAEQAEWLSQQYGTDDPPVQTVVDISYAFVEALISDPLMRASIRMTIDRAAPPESIVHGYSSWITAVTELLDRARDAGTLKDDVKTSETAYTITSAVTGLQLTSAALSQRRDLPERVENLWALIIPAVVRPELLPRVEIRPPQRRRRKNVSPV